MRALLVAFVLLFPATLSAQSLSCAGGVCGPSQPAWQPVQKVAQRVIVSANDSCPWVCRIRGSHTDGSWSTGTGSLVYEDEDIAYVLTAKHVIRGVTGRIICHFPDGKAYAARVGQVDSATDLARLEIRPTGIQPANVRRSQPEEGERLWVAGYGGDGRYRAAVGQASYQWQDNLGVSGAYVRSGDSGGPVVDSKGRFVTVLWGCSREVNGTMACRWTPVRNILSGVWGRLRNRARSRQQLIDQRQQQLGIGYTQPQAPSGEEDPRPAIDPDLSDAPDEDRLQRIEDQLAAIANRIDSIEVREGPEGPQGPAGPRGPAGPAGPSGEEVDEEAIAQRAAQIVSQNFEIDADSLISQLPPIKVDIIWPDGSVRHQEVRLGETLRLKFIPVDVLGPESGN